ncbi:MAG: hypothetical protein LBK58_14810 [Prevotellaceae bacterium]|jgi:hypothetical protein|nr:hypothetical protein [Prevotellaceae bacterium]
MAIPYVIIPKGNPDNPEAPKKYYAQTKASSEVSLKKTRQGNFGRAAQRSAIPM